jgi:hypothetical protein
MSKKATCDEGDRDWIKALGTARIEFWACPIEGHSFGGPLRETVRWVEGVARCLEPGCGRTSADPT